MEYYWMFVVFVFGAIIGSFLDVILYRLHTAKSLNGRSHCLSCGAQLRWFELVPIVSFLTLRARCRTCRARIPWRCLLMELTTGGAFVIMWQLYAYDYVLAVLSMALAAVLILIVAYDLRHMIIPDELVGVLFVLALGILVAQASAAGSLTDVLVVHGLAGALGGLFFAAFWFFSKGAWMGLGDAKLMVPLGFLLGPWGTCTAIVLAFWTGAAISVLVLAAAYLWRTRHVLTAYAALVMSTGMKRKERARRSYPSARVAKYRGYLTMKHEVPFAPFLILGFALVHFFHVDLFAFFSLYF